MATVRPSDRPGIRPVVAVAGGLRRRPSGEAPPLPRTVDPGTLLCLGLVAATALLEAALAVPPLRGWLTRLDAEVVGALAGLRADPLTAALEAVAALASPWPSRVLFWATLVGLLLVRRFHHLAAYLAVLLLTVLTATALNVLHGRMRPPGVDVLGGWEGYAHPALPLTVLAVTAVGAVRTLVPAGELRRRAGLAAGGVVAAVALARVWLGVEAPSDVLAAAGLGGALPVAALGLLLPEDAFPVRYGVGRRAHVELGERRRRAVRQALQDQLGLRATALEPFGLAGSAGSTPLRVEVDGRALFAKLYTVTHLRADRWYKLARMVLYGRLEDEKPFATVRRLVEYEDHMLRLLRDAHLPVPAPYGLVEITPEREYVVVMEFFDGAREIGEVELTDAEIDDGLRLVRRLWEAGVAHRDIKPSNLLARGGRVLLIDVAFATVRPTPWRQAVDLANMMLTLALSSSAERVYERALRQFAPDDVAEAFAASRSITLPTQLRARLRADGRDLPGRFRTLAPPRRPVPIQLWSLRRVLLTLAVVAGFALTGLALVAYAEVANLL